MKWFLNRGLPLILTVFVVGCSTSQAKVDVTAVESAIRGLDEKVVSAVAAKDIETIVSVYTEDAYILPANGQRGQGHEAIRAVWQEFLDMPGLTFNAQPFKVMVSEAGDMAVGLGTYTMQMEGSAGPIQDAGKYMAVLKKVGEEWKIVADTWNSDMPLPMP